MTCSKRGQLPPRPKGQTAIAEVPRQIEFPYRLVLDASHHASTDPLGRSSLGPLCRGCHADRRRATSKTWPSATAADRWRGSTPTPRSDPEVRPSPTTDRVDPRQESRHRPSLGRPRCRWDIPASQTSPDAVSARPRIAVTVSPCPLSLGPTNVHRWTHLDYLKRSMTGPKAA
jgi:hypothetical protein